MIDPLKQQAEQLRLWLKQRLAARAIRCPTTEGPSSVTLVAYHFWDPVSFDGRFDELESAIRETWHQCGFLKTILVVNRITRRIEDFAEDASGWISLHLCKDLIPGNLYSMSTDCILRLHTRFHSDYVLIIQNDGFPIRPGLEAFLGTYDYFGAPWQSGKDDWVTRFLLRHRNDVGNGGFSLRSKRLCEISAWYYRRKYKLIPHCYLMTEDYFICKTLPSFEKHYRETIRIAPADVAATFSLEENITLHHAVSASPFGFHGPAAFAHLQKEGLIPYLES